MPRNQFAAVKPYVQEFCKKHGVKYHEKTFYDALADIVRYTVSYYTIYTKPLHLNYLLKSNFLCYRSLKESSDIWADAYDTHIPLKAD